MKDDLNILIIWVSTVALIFLVPYQILILSDTYGFPSEVSAVVEYQLHTAKWNSEQIAAAAYQQYLFDRSMERIKEVR